MHGHVQWAEFVPVAPLLPALGELAGYLVAFGLCIVAAYFVKALFGAAESGLGWIPWVGSAIKGSLHAIEQRLTNGLGAAAAALDSRMALAWHKLESTAKWMAHEIAANSGVLLALATVMTQPWNIPAWKALLGQVSKQGQAVLRIIRADVHAATRPIYGELHGLERWTYPKVRHAVHEVDVAIPKDIAGLRARARSIEDSLGAAWAKIKAQEAKLTSTALTAVVAVALAELGLGWLRCSSLRNIGNRLACSGFSFLEDLLAPAFLAFEALDICDFANAAQTLALEFQPVLMEIVDVENALIGCHGAELPQALALPALRLPSNSLGLTLAA